MEARSTGRSAETGLDDANFTRLSGLEDGVPTNDGETLPLVPEGRELERALTHEAPIGPGWSLFGVAHPWDARHEPGASGWGIGVAYRRNGEEIIEVSGALAVVGLEP